MGKGQRLKKTRGKEVGTALGRKLSGKGKESRGERNRGHKKRDQESREKEAFLKRRSYDEYHYTPGEVGKYCLLVLGVFGGLDYLFYQSLPLMLLAPPLCLWFFKAEKNTLIRERRRRIGEAFRDALVSLNVAVQAGYSIENALRECRLDLQKMYPPGSDILEELTYMENQLYLSVPVEDLFLDLARRTGAEDIESFAAVFVTAKRTGGDMSQIIQRTAMAISDKIDVKREIHATLAGKKYEQTIMSLMPVGIILYLRLTSPGYLDVLYGNALGVLVMSACLLLYGFSFWLGRRIIQIEV